LEGISIIAVDLGASSGRIVSGSFDGCRIRFGPEYRFTNSIVTLGNSCYWDFLNIWDNINKGIVQTGKKLGNDISCIAVDSWGADFCMFDSKNNLIANPFCYRDPRTRGTLESIYESIPPEELFMITGNQPSEISTLCQLYSMVRDESPFLEICQFILPISNAVTFLLSKEKNFDFTNASGSILYDCSKKGWSRFILDKLGIEKSILPGIRENVAIAGEISEDPGIGKTKIADVGGHDTALAVMAAPAGQKGYLYINSGTWSVVGIKGYEPVTGRAVFENGITNWGTPDGGYTQCKMMTGLWILQECRRAWKEDDIDLACDQIYGPGKSMIDVDDIHFLSPGNMPGKIAEYCAMTSQPIPHTQREVYCCILQSLALKYRQVIGQIEEATGTYHDTLYFMGGGSKDRSLCQFTADACNRDVVAGPGESAIIGNMLMQLRALGEIDGHAQEQDILGNTIETAVYVPGPTGFWDEVYEKYQKILSFKSGRDSK